MSYVVLARRYRPQRFSDLVGQEHVAQTLKNAFKLSRTAHAYLFTGPRGVGKTSAARILAKALRCENMGEDFEPCNECDSCRAINEGTSMDVVEIDAASNTGVDNIRELRDSVGYMATQGKYRVFIIDEVHMLSTAAFNALLKTLEEPPPHVVFIFATTELHKVLPTIISRCQRFDFKRIPESVIQDNLRGVCQSENVSIDEASLRTLALEADGCMRDAQSLLDQSIALCGTKIEIAALETALGIVDRKSFFELVLAIAKHDTARALDLASQMADKGMDPKVLLGRLVMFFRDLHYVAFTGKNPVGDDAELLSVFNEAKAHSAPDEIIRALDLSLRTQSTLGSSSNAQITLESLVVKLALQRPALQAMGHSVSAPSYSAPSSAPAAPSRAAPPQQASRAPALQSAPAPQTASASPTSADDLSGLENYIRTKKPAWTPVLGSIVNFEKNGNALKVLAKNDFAGRRLASKDGLDVLKAAYGVTQVEVDLEAEVQAERRPNPAELQVQKRRLAVEHEAVQSAIKIFDAKISDTKIQQDSRSKEKTR
ncbi:MAG TPA: DNA polymerase III subunit gamma/tau [Bdellovibrionota bacterium]|nr:DNA polymerase III subunit gamma/tau [Bdellovibrionota bacterium]